LDHKHVGYVACSQMARYTTTGRLENDSRSYTYNSNLFSKCDTQSSGSLQYETTASPRGGTVFMPPLSSQRRVTQLPVPRNTQGWTPYIEHSFIQCFFFFLRLITTAVTKITVSVATAWTGTNNLWNVIQTERNRKTSRKHTAVPHFPPQMPHRKVSDWNRTSAVGRQHLTT